MTANPSKQTDTPIAPDEQIETQPAEAAPDGPRIPIPLLFVVFMLLGFGMAALVLTFGNDNNATARTARVPSSGAGAVAGWQVPDFEMQTLDGETVNLSDYRGQVVFLNFWATWCGPCQREMPAFDAFMAQGRDDAVILAINNGENIPEIVEFVDLFGLQHVPIMLDTEFAISDGFGVVNLPITYVLDGDGVVRYTKLGEVTLDELETYVTAVQTGA